MSSVVAATVGAVIAFQSVNASSMALDRARHEIGDIERTISRRAAELFDPLLVFAGQVVKVPGVDTRPSLLPVPAAPLVLEFLERYPAVTSAYLGFDDGRFFQVVNLGGKREAVARELGAPPEARFAVRLVLPDANGAPREIVRFLDHLWRTVGSTRAAATDYDPRERPWYRGAINRAATHVTGLYPFANEPGHGMTVARRFDGDAVGVVGIDVTLSAVSRFLHEQERAVLQQKNGDGVLFIFTREGGVIAHSDPPVGADGTFAGPSRSGIEPRSAMNFQDGFTREVYSHFGEWKNGGENGRAAAILPLRGQRHVVHFSPMTLPDGTEVYLASALSLAPFTAPMMEAQLWSLLVSVVIVIALVPLSFLAASAISRPIQSLTAEARRMHSLSLDDQTGHTQSFIFEIHDLAQSLSAARSAIRGFGKYVPKYVVRQIVKAGEIPRIGGTRREISILFTDLEGFTSWSQTLEPEALAEEMSRYLSGVSDIIEAHDGTVDKFVGDAVMAYWNAPADVEDYVAKACVGSLECRDWANRMMLRQPGGEGERRLFYTRFGLHVGDVVAGNVGSEERMDYTVLGAPINLGSRLEPLNKYYGTQILVSEQVAAACRDRFLFRWLDTVLPVGAHEPMDVLELVGARPDWDGAPPQLVANHAEMEAYKAWEPVRGLYRARDWHGLIEVVENLERRFGKTKLTALYLERAHHFIAEPPPPDWDFVTVYLSKR